VTADQLRDALWRLAWGGWVTADSFGPVRAYLSGGRTAHKTTRRRTTRPFMGRRVLSTAALAARGGNGYAARRAAGAGDARTAGRWSLAPTPAAHGAVMPGTDGGTGGAPEAAAGPAVTLEELRAAQVGALMERYGVVTRGSAAVEASFASVYPVLAQLEDHGAVRRGYFVEKLGGSQFALPPVPDLLRGAAGDASVVVLAASDPANPYGAALAWPPHAGTHRPGRGAGAIVVLVGGELCLYVERGGHTALWFPTGGTAGRSDGGGAQSGSAGAGIGGENPATEPGGEVGETAGRDLERAAQALASAVTGGAVDSLKLTKLDGVDALRAQAELQPLARALIGAGFAVTPGGLRLRAGAGPVGAAWSARKREPGGGAAGHAGGPGWVTRR
jgi:ATP-dependent Lhr-like helicase